MVARQLCQYFLRSVTVDNGPMLPIKIVRCFSVTVAKKKKLKTHMKSWQIHQYGGNEELTLSVSSKIPEIKHPKDLLVEVHASSVNPIDVKMRGGYGKTIINQMRKCLGALSSSEFPLTLGRDFSGIVVQTGHGVTRFKPGDKVWGALSAERQGSHAQYVVTREGEISLSPKSISDIEAGSLPYVALTTWNALCVAGELTEKTTPLKRVLIHAGAGGIGTFAIQLMKAWGAHVITTCSTDAKPLVQHLGADDIIDYKTQNVEEELKKLRQVDVVLDPLGGEMPSFSLDMLKSWSGAKYITLVSPLMSNMDKLGLVGGLMKSAADFNCNVIKGFTKGGVHYRWAFFIPNGSALVKVAAMVDQGQIYPIIDKVFKFEEVPKAFDKVAKGNNRGKTVINVLA